MANPNPSPATRFKPGQSGNPSGKSSKQAEKERKSAEIAANLVNVGLSYVQDKLETGEINVMDIMNGDMLRFIQEAQNRAYGTPKATTEVGGVNGGPIPVSTVTYQVHDPKCDGD